MSQTTAATSTETRVFRRDLRGKHLVVDHAEGVHVWDTDGTRYLDASSGASVVVSIGYGVPEILEAMQDQARRVCYSAGFTSAPEEDLARELGDFAPGDLDYVRLTSGGSESNETAIKLARHYFVETGRPSKYKIVGRWRSYHGNTLGALAASGHVLRRAEYEPMLPASAHAAPPYRYRCDFCAGRNECTLQCADDVERVILNEGPEYVAAFIAEPIVGSAALGMMPADGYFRRVREICDKYDVLMIMDEVLTGMGRTGANFAIDHWGVVPDMIACGKGISSGYTPLGAVITSDRIHRAVADGSGSFEHGYTFGGNPLSSAVGLAVLRYLREHDLVSAAAEGGQYLLDSITSALGDHPHVGEISGKGMLVGIEMVQDRTTKEPFPYDWSVRSKVVHACARRGVLINSSFSGNVDGYRGDRFGVCPPYIFTRENIDETVAALTDAIDEVVNGLG